MKKLNETIYNKLLLQAQEAKEQGMVKLAEGIFGAIGSFPAEEFEEYSYNDLKNDIHKDLWKIASKIMYYYNLESVDADKLDKTLVSWANKVTDDLENTLEVDESMGVFEPKTPGEK